MVEATLASTLVGRSEAIRSLRDLVTRVAPRNIAILIQGPTGAGKELIAAALHRLSGRPGRFVPFNVCAIPETMFEDALFGHVRGAFTGAGATTPGYVAEADGGTLFMDEISGLGMAQQAKLLRVLETRQFRPVGAGRDRASDFRLISATNEDLASLAHAGGFRMDLLYRLNGIIITVPALAERREDIPLLVRHFLSRLLPDQEIGITAGALRLLQDHDWPGNVRELGHTVQRAVVLSDAEVLTRDDVARALQTAAPAPRPAHSAEREQLVRTLALCDWEPTRAAAVLGVHWTTVYRRMRRLGVTRPMEVPPRPERDRVHLADPSFVLVSG